MEFFPAYSFCYDLINVSYEPKLVAKNVFLKTEVLDLTIELIRTNILL